MQTFGPTLSDALPSALLEPPPLPPAEPPPPPPQHTLPHTTDFLSTFTRTIGTGYTNQSARILLVLFFSRLVVPVAAPVQITSIIQTLTVLSRSRSHGRSTHCSIDMSCLPIHSRSSPLAPTLAPCETWPRQVGSTYVPRPDDLCKVRRLVTSRARRRRCLVLAVNESEAECYTGRLWHVPILGESRSGWDLADWLTPVRAASLALVEGGKRQPRYERGTRRRL